MTGQTHSNEVPRTFGQWVKQQRKALGLTQDNLAQRVACSKSMINKIEGDLRSPTKPMLELLALHLKISQADYEHFVHLAQPHLLVEPDELLHKDSASVVKALPKTSKGQPVPITPLIGREREVESVSSLSSSGFK